jgi:phenylalanyl-tRNA synthetase alpha chain
MHIRVENTESLKLRTELNNKQDPESRRIKRFLDMPDLSRENGSPVNELVQRIINLKRFAGFEIMEVPEIVRADVSFDLFNFPPDHPARSRSDTYYLDDNHILRTHTTVMWYYHLEQDEIKKRIERGESVGGLSFGKVYRKDEIDRNHMNVFHQMDGWYLCRKAEKKIGLDDLKEVLTEIAQAIFGQNIEYRFNVDQFPYTDPSCEMEIKIGSRPASAGSSGPLRQSSSEASEAKWVEVLGSGVVRGSVLEKLGVDPEVYNGWAFGFGLERLAIISMELPDIRLLWSQDERVKRQLKLGNKFKEVSKFPPITRDISFVVDKSFIPNNYFDLIRDLGSSTSLTAGGDLVEQVELLDKYENEEKFGKDKISYTYRIVYRSNERTLTTEEIDPIQKNIYDETASQFNAELR